MKTCSACRVSKSPSDFYRNKAQRDGLQNECRECFKETIKASKKKNWERIKAEKTRYATRHKDQLREAARKWRAKRRELFPGLDSGRSLDRYYSDHPNSPCVYVVQAETGQVKIGHTINLPVRLSMLQCGSPVRLSVIHIQAFQTKIEAADGERALRKQFSSCRIHGEWFNPNAAMTLWISVMIAEGAKDANASF